MNRILPSISIAIFAIFLGSQITEGVLLVPYWKSLSAAAFYDYYSAFGPSIGTFYTCLTVLAVLVPICLSVYCLYKKSPALKYSLVALIFALLVIAVFYLYFKEINELFYSRSFDENQLKLVLNDWGRWHWLRVIFESTSLLFLILTHSALTQINNKS